jgi:hypothetical protein
LRAATHNDAHTFGSKCCGNGMPMPAVLPDTNASWLVNFVSL